MTPEQRYRLEMAKDRTPSTSLFVWFVPLFLIGCWLCQTDDGKQVTREYTVYAGGTRKGIRLELRLWSSQTLLSWVMPLILNPLRPYPGCNSASIRQAIRSAAGMAGAFLGGVYENRHPVHNPWNVHGACLVLLGKVCRYMDAGAGRSESQ